LTGIGTITQARIDLSAEATQKIIPSLLKKAQKMNSRYISTEHLLLAIVNSDEGLCEDVLAKLGVTFEQVRRQINREINQKQAPLCVPPNRKKAHRLLRKKGRRPRW
jgi:ATP-dependent Clp protease ATP-binding subunit ClpC